MSVKLLESFDHSENINELAGAQRRWNQQSNFISTPNGRIGRGVEATSAEGFMSIPIDQFGFTNLTDDGQEFFVGFAFRPIITSTLERGIIGVRTDPILGTIANYNFLTYDPDGSLKQFRGGGSSPGPTSLGGTTLPGVLVHGQWHYIEWHLIRVNGAGGRSTVKVDGTEVLDFSGDTVNQTSTETPTLMLGRQSNGGGGPYRTVIGNRWDDLYYVANDGIGHSDFLGQIYIPLLVPNANGTFSEWQGSDGNQVDNYLLVDETVAISDLDYVEASADGERDTYNHSTYTIEPGHSISSVQVTARAAYLSAAKKLKLASRLSDGTYESKESLFPLSSQLNPRWINFEERPGGGAWTQTDLDNAEFGVEQAPSP